jgi:hypothetical protein
LIQPENKQRYVERRQYNTPHSRAAAILVEGKSMGEMDNGKACERASLAVIEYYACKAGIRYNRKYNKENPLSQNTRITWSKFMARPGGLHPESAKAVEAAAYYAQEEEDERAEALHQTAYATNVALRGEGSAVGSVNVDEAHPGVRSVLTALPATYRAQGKQAIVDEIETLVDLNVFEWVTLPPGGRTIPSRIAEKVKFKGDGSFDKVKMRCVVKGYMQRSGLDFGVVYSQTAMISFVHIVLCIAVTR